MEAGIHELTAGYALDALDPEERSAYEAHLAGLRALPAGARVVLDDDRGAGRRGVRAGAEPGSARAHPRGRPRRAPAERRAVRAAAPARRARARRGRGGRGRRRARNRAVGVESVERARRDAHRARAPAGRGRRSSPIPAHDRVALAAGRGPSRRRRRTDEAVLVVDGLDPAPAGKTYEMWIVPEATSTLRIAPGCSRARTDARSSRSTGTVTPGESSR